MRSKVIQPSSDWEDRVEALARAFTYPPSPDLTRRAPHPVAFGRPAARWILAAAIVLALLVGLMAVPGVRAAVMEALRLGAVRIFLTEPTPAPVEERSDATPLLPTATPLASVLDLAGETTLDGARQQLPFPLLLPTYPADLALPGRVFVQELDGPTVVLVWLEPGQEEEVRLSLTQTGGGLSFDKRNIRQIQETYVNGRWALWIDGPHLLQARNGDQMLQRLVQQGHVLLWEHAGVTYRLETDLPLVEARKVAESLATTEDR